MSNIDIDKILMEIGMASIELGVTHGIEVVGADGSCVTVYVQRVGDEYTFGHSISTTSAYEEVSCGRNWFSGEAERLFVGYLKVLSKHWLLEQNCVLKIACLEVVRAIGDSIGRISVDKSKIDLSEWKMPKNTLRGFSL